jgi:hypothetical protein
MVRPVAPNNVVHGLLVRRRESQLFQPDPNRSVGSTAPEASPTRSVRRGKARRVCPRIDHASTATVLTP